MGTRNSTWYLLVLFFSLFLFVKSSHFRGATFSWKPTSVSNEIEIAWRISWRRTTSSHFCDVQTVTSETLKSGEGDLNCYTGCSSGVSLTYYCTDFSESEDWTTGVNTAKFSSSSPTFTMRFNGGNWIGGLQVGSNGRWSLPMYVNLTTREDTGMPNSSPVSSVTPIVRLQYGCNHTFVIPVSDSDDGDTVRCRWASGFLECDDVCNGFPNAILDENTCTIQYNAVYSEGLYAVALMIADFDTEFSTTPLSQIPLQFIVNVSRSGMSCAASPEFVYPTPEDGSCISVPENETYRQTIAAVSGSDGVDIYAIDTVSPFGFLKSPVIRNNDIFFVNLTWTPTQQQLGANILCYTAHNTEGQSTPQTCITLVVGASAPHIIRDSIEPAPGSFVPSTQSTWRLKFDTEFQRPTTPTYIRFYKADYNNILVHSIDVSTSSSVSYMSAERSIEFTTNGLYLQENKTYYILMDSGVARGMELCGSESPAIMDPSFWWFKIGTGLCGGGCLNGGTCDVSDGGPGDCNCRRGFAGPTCKRILGYCSSCNIP